MAPAYIGIIIGAVVSAIVILLGIQLVKAAGIVIFGEDVIFPCISCPNPFLGV